MNEPVYRPWGTPDDAFWAPEQTELPPQHAAPSEPPPFTPWDLSDAPPVPPQAPVQAPVAPPQALPAPWVPEPAGRASIVETDVELDYSLSAPTTPTPAPEPGYRIHYAPLPPEAVLWPPPSPPAAPWREALIARAQHLGKQLADRHGPHSPLAARWELLRDELAMDRDEPTATARLWIATAQTLADTADTAKLATVATSAHQSWSRIPQPRPEELTSRLGDVLARADLHDLAATLPTTADLVSTS
ncbi:hypothetical protein [Streptomyces bohaiensis]|uniref:hypothetical protein n=1 Tax=Streptomyces bohaiensis TaxID=1431344 RepID=UPI003B78DE73